MQNLQNSILPFLLSIFLASLKCIHAITDTVTDTGTVDNCLTQVCSYDEPLTRYVRFPFRIRNDSLPKSCGYPGFDLFCGGSNKLLVDLPNSEVFSVQAIDYVRQELWINDPNNCLPKMLLSFNLSIFDNSPFTPRLQSRKRYWLYNCSNVYFKSFGIKIKPIRCLSGSTYGVAASPVKINNNVTARLCAYLGTIELPTGSQSNTVQSLDLSGDIRLSWVEPGCGGCYMKKGRCGFKSYSSLEVGCFDVPSHDFPGLSKQTIVAIAFGIAGPFAILTCCTTYFALRAICSRVRRRNNANIAVTPHQEPVIVNNGLDRSIIESYPKTVLGESCRLPKPDDKSCPICLGEYLAMETLRSLPDCAHCFHADCIDEWLELNASCPVCRNTPSNSLDVT
ncbi:putative RING-H2 finger protein ATL21A [Silene latifolia]|uniref:putative RING-H2 finger protein ATL21A n=1 Tax=Silene latifolia TaxID=37657 RepID=UPI003D789E9B